MSYLYNQSANVVTFSTGANPQLDVQDRLRVSTPAQQWWFVASTDTSEDLKYNKLATGNGANTLFIQNLAAVELAGGTDTNSSIIRASRRRHKILPAISHQWYSTINWEGADTNTTKRAGMFTNFNGTFWYVDGTDVGVASRRRLIDGTLVEVSNTRSTFNYDKLDGTGPSGVDITSKIIQNLSTYVSTSNVGIQVQNGDVANTNVYNVVFNTQNNVSSILATGSKVLVQGITPNTYNGIAMVSNTTSSTITLTYTKNPGTYSSGVATANLTHTGLMDAHSWFIDYEGGKSARVRYGIVSSIGPVICHIQDFSTFPTGSPFFSAPALMERVEIVKTGAMSSYNPTMTIHGVTYNVEAEVALNPAFGFANSNSSGVSYTAVGNSFPILGISIRYGEPYQRTDLQLRNINIIDANNNLIGATGGGPGAVTYYAASYQWQLILNPTIGGTVPSPVNIGKSSQYWTYGASTTCSGGIPLVGGIFSSASSIDVTQALNFINLGSNINYTSADQVVLVVKMIDAGNVSGNIFATLSFLENL